MKNHLYTKSYMYQRLRGAGILVEKLDIEYDHQNDTRRWTFIIDPKHHNIMLTCHKTNDDHWFVISSAQCSSFIVRTLSAEVLINLFKSMITENNNKDVSHTHAAEKSNVSDIHS